MKIADILQQNTYSLSFEVFPPKIETAFEKVQKAAEDIAALSPSFMSVTYGAGGGTSRYTLDIARHLQDTYGVPTMAHLTCVSSTKDMVTKQIAAMRDNGIKNVMALRGDIPQNLQDADQSRWEYTHAVELVRQLRASGGDFCIGGACYPEAHPESTHQNEDIRFLKEKVGAGCDFLTTQMVFDNNLLYNFMYKIREAGITVPVVAGIMPITNAVYLKRALELSGSFVPRRFVSMVDTFGDNPHAMKQVGIAYATDQIIDLFANGITHVHVYSMNNADVAKQILDNLSVVLGR